MGRPQADTIHVVLAVLTNRQYDLAVEALSRANAAARRSGSPVMLSFRRVESRGIAILARARDADVAVFGLEDDQLPGEASHLIAVEPGIRVVGIDLDARPRTVFGGTREPLADDLPAVIHWITRTADRGQSASGH